MSGGTVLHILKLGARLRWQINSCPSRFTSQIIAPPDTPCHLDAVKITKFILAEIEPLSSSHSLYWLIWHSSQANIHEISTQYSGCNINKVQSNGYVMNIHEHQRRMQNRQERICETCVLHPAITYIAVEPSVLLFRVRMVPRSIFRFADVILWFCSWFS